MYRGLQDIYSCTEVEKICTPVKRLIGYVLMYRVWQDVYSCIEVERSCTHVQKLEGYLLS